MCSYMATNFRIFVSTNLFLLLPSFLADRQLLLLCWSGWRQFKYFSKERAATNQYCTRQANMSRLAWAFRTWLREYRKKLQQKEQHAVAARHFRKSLLQHVSLSLTAVTTVAHIRGGPCGLTWFHCCFLLLILYTVPQQCVCEKFSLLTLHI